MAEKRKVQERGKVQSQAEEAVRLHPDVVEDGFEASKVMAIIKQLLAEGREGSTKELLRRVRTVFQLNVHSAKGQQAQWYIDLKKQGAVAKGKAPHRPDVTIWISDRDFIAVATGAANPARLFAAGRVRFRGHIDILVRGERIFTHERQRLYASLEGNSEEDAQVAHDDVVKAINRRARRRGLFGWAKL